MKIRREGLATSALVILLYFALAFGIYQGLTRHVIGANDFYSRWAGARALFLHGENPYSDAVTREIQMTLFGRLARPDEDQLAFAYPIYAALIVAPLVALPYAYAQALWMAFLIVALMSGTLALVSVYNFKPSPRALVALLFGVLVFYPAVRGIFLGQYALAAFFCLALARWAIETRRDALAGILLAFATIKPQMAVLIVPLVALWAARRARWRVVIGAAATLGVLIALGWFWLANWHIEFLRALNAYAGYTRIGPPLATALAIILPREWVDLVALGAALGLIGAALIAWAQCRDDITGAFNFTAVVTTLIAIRIGTPDQVLLLFPILDWITRLIQQRRIGWAVLFAAGLIVAPWLVFLATVQGFTEHPAATIILPLVALIGCLIAYLSTVRRKETPT